MRGVSLGPTTSVALIGSGVIFLLIPSAAAIVSFTCITRRVISLIPTTFVALITINRVSLLIASCRSPLLIIVVAWWHIASPRILFTEIRATRRGLPLAFLLRFGGRRGRRRRRWRRWCTASVSHGGIVGGPRLLLPFSLLEVSITLLSRVVAIVVPLKATSIVTGVPFVIVKGVVAICKVVVVVAVALMPVTIVGIVSRSTVIVVIPSVIFLSPFARFCIVRTSNTGIRRSSFCSILLLQIV